MIKCKNFLYFLKKFNKNAKIILCFIDIINQFLFA
ncbi:hypothetical protein CUP1309 [Campylobacter upsaliensis RM3195]|nr:hypothetical protein CUP1309 [Campylobacter upsaliensis RM3195]